MVMNRYHGTKVCPSWKPVVPKNVGIWRVRLFGSQMPTARPIRNEHQADGHHELRDQGRAGEPPHQDSFDAARRAAARR